MPLQADTINYIALGGLALLLVLGLIFFSLRFKRMAAQIQELTQSQQDQFQQTAYILQEQKNLSTTAFQDMSNGLFSTLSTVSQNQSTQLEAVQQRLSLSARTQEERMEKLSATVSIGLEKYDGRMSQVTRTLDEKLLQNENRIEKLRTTMETSMQALQTDNGKRLEEMRKTVDEKLHETLDKRLTESFSQVSQRLEQVYKGLGEMQTLAAGVGDLKKVLTNVKTRGIWGEMQLGAILSQMLAPNQYEENVAVKPGSSERVEFAIKLPGRDEDAVYLAIDSKFPQEDYTRLVDASESGDKALVDEARKALITQLKTEGKRISQKYIAPPHTTDFAIMFLPIEGLYAEIMRDMDVAEQLQREQRVVIAGPSTLSALLNSLQMGFRTVAIEKRSAEVWKLLGAVKTDFGRFSDVLEKTQTKLRQASESIDSAFVRTRSIQRHLRKVEAVDELETEQVLQLDDLDEA